MIAFRYTVMRLMIFVGFLALFVLVGLDQIWALVFAALFFPSSIFTSNIASMSTSLRTHLP